MDIVFDGYNSNSDQLSQVGSQMSIITSKHTLLYRPNCFFYVFNAQSSSIDKMWDVPASTMLKNLAHLV